MPQTQNPDEPKHPIAVVSRQTGLAQDLLRAWERRYEAVVPARTDTGRRLYTDQDLVKLRLLKRAVESGHRIGDIAALTVSELEATLGPAAAPAPPPAASRSGSQYVQEALVVISELDAYGLQRLLREASVEFSPPALRREVLEPLLQAIGEGWRRGDLRVANEHLATAVIRSFLGTTTTLDPALGRPVVIVATPSGHRHELGALLAASAAAEVGWSAVYLGPDVPAEEIAAAARQRQARVLALSVICPANDPNTAGELTRLRELVGPQLPIFVGGAAAVSYADALEAASIRRLEDAADLQRALDQLA